MAKLCLRSQPHEMGFELLLIKYRPQINRIRLTGSNRRGCEALESFRMSQEHIHLYPLTSYRARRGKQTESEWKLICPLDQIPNVSVSHLSQEMVKYSIWHQTTTGHIVYSFTSKGRKDVLTAPTVNIVITIWGFNFCCMEQCIQHRL